MYASENGNSILIKCTLSLGPQKKSLGLRYAILHIQCLRQICGNFTWEEDRGRSSKSLSSKFWISTRPIYPYIHILSLQSILEFFVSCLGQPGA